MQVIFVTVLLSDFFLGESMEDHVAAAQQWRAGSAHDVKCLGFFLVFFFFFFFFFFVVVVVVVVVVVPNQDQKANRCESLFLFDVYYVLEFL